MKQSLNGERKARILLFAVLFASCLFIFRNYLFGNEVMVYDDVGGDTWQQYTMHYASIVNHLRNGNFALWDFTNGMGTNMFNFNLFDPSLMLLYGIGVLLRPAHMLLYLVWLQILKVLAAGYVCYWFLSEFSYSRSARLMASYAYGLCGYLLVWGQHYQFGMVVVYFPLMLLFCEKYIQKKKYRGFFPVTVFLCGIYSVYFTYMCLIAVGFYLLFRVWMLKKRTAGERILCFAGGCAQMLLGVGMSLVVFLPMANVLLNVSSRLSGGEGLMEMLKECFQLQSSACYESYLVRMFSSNFQNLQLLGDVPYGGMWNYYEDPVLFCSTLVAFLDVQFLAVFWRGKEDRRTKLWGYGAAAFVGALVLLKGGSIAFNAFSAPTFRFTFVLTPFFVLAAAWCWDFLKKGGRASIAAAAVVTVLLLRACRIGYLESLFVQYRRNALILGAAGIVVALCLVALVFFQKKQVRGAAMAVMLAAMAVSVLSEGSVGYEKRISLKKTDTPAEQYESQAELTAQLSAREAPEEQAEAVFTKPQSYFRELYSQDIKDALSYLEENDSEFYRVEKDFMSATISMDALAQGYRGVSTYNSVMNGNVKEFVDTCYPEFYYADQNRYAFWQNAQDNEMASFLGIRYLLSRDGNLDSGTYRLVKPFGGIYLYENAMETDMARFYEHAVSEESLKKLCTEETRDVLLQSVIATEGGEELDSVEDLPKTGEKQSEVLLDAPQKDSLVTGTIRAASDGYVLFMIPYEDGWSLTIDGQETKLLRGDLGFLACAVTEGEHSLELTFHAPLLKEGALASILCWTLFLGWQVVAYRKRRGC